MSSKIKASKQKITPFLWFNDNAEEAVGFYVSVFDNSEVGTVTHYDKASAMASGRAEGTVMTVSFELEGQQFIALNGGPEFNFTPAISFVVNCETQPEIDYFWEKLSEGGKEIECGWLEDKYGVSWQIVPEVLGELMKNKDSKKSGRVMEALMKMKKLDIEALEEAAG
ncbi:MAG TPA: VOC family protein [Hanamia sp.]|nr:VOC family protein [Hanamia sp.]